ncbi:MAG: TonB-dependent receptor [Algibacter sp.]|uniref:SusC/RagA family TonB-linked outer membrane protein n=1 Tax=Algibacter sp. TaxID=1872428 RepID=UPI0026018A9D|nr:TonB-dependent receptor [Algibacter sp.]MDG1731268.1 TonB-dependent receptor [Algibacter sp.]MDG2178791.1 TonB-dependent receptor [Algibacter sp.]
MKKQITVLLRRSFFLGILLMFMGFDQANAQQTINGTVVDDSGVGIPGANIIIKGTSQGSVTDFDGNFSISASSNDVLEISFLGYVTQTITVGNQTTINVTLAEDTAKLETVVVIGYGTAKKSDVTGAVSQVSAKSFEDQPLVRVENALQGRASGVTVAGSGSPGKGIKVRIRGVNSITGNNDPLVVVDGVFGGDLRTINPNNIASMEVLKDASALAIYGSRGSNGVILVTTKKGSGKAKVVFDQFITVSNINKRIPTLSSAQFATLENEEFIANPVNDPADAPYSAAQIEAFEASPIRYQDLMFQTGFTNNTQLSISGSTNDKLRYFLSGNFMDQKGTQITSNYRRYSFRSNVSKEFNDKLSVTANVTASREITNNDQDAFNSPDGSSILRAMTWDPTAPVRDENGDYILRSPREVANNNFNPIRRLELSDHEVTADRLNITLNGKYNFTDNISYTLVTSVSTFHRNTESFRVEGDFDATGFTNISYQNNNATSHQVSNILNWNQSFNKHNFDVTGVYEFQGTRALNNGYAVNDLNVGGLYLADESANETFSNSGDESAIQSYLGRAQYNFNSFLYLTGSLRVDESSRFSKDNRTGYFPSGAIAVNLAKLEFIEKSPLSSLKFRAGWGKVGNQNINASARFSLNNNSGLYTIDGETTNTGSVQSQEGNPNLTWETTTQTNIGLDFGFLNGRITGSIDWFNKDTEDLLLQTIVPGTSIITFINAGEVNNKGIDFSIGADIIQKDDFNWNASFNLSSLKNKVTKLNDGADFIVGNASGIGGAGIRLNVIKVGEPLGTFWGYEAQGTWKTTDNIPVDGDGNSLFQPGDAKFKLDENNELEFNTIGSGLPDVTFGFNNTFTYKNWDLNIFLNGSLGFDVYNQARGTITGNGGNRSNLSPDVYNRWTPENETDLPRAGTGNVLNSSRWVEKGDFVRLSNLKLGYTFDDTLISGINSLQLYASGQNVFLITDYKGYDPEVSSLVQGGANEDAGAGIDSGAYPNPVSFTIGLKVQF